MTIFNSFSCKLLIFGEIIAYLWKRKNGYLYFIKIMNFAVFKQNNNVFSQKNHALKIYQQWDDFVIWQLVANFADFWWINSVCIGEKFMYCTFKKWEENHIFDN